eukprot:3940280-Rhodomonas_salina.3
MFCEGAPTLGEVAAVPSRTSTPPMLVARYARSVLDAVYRVRYIIGTGTCPTSRDCPSCWQLLRLLENVTSTAMVYFAWSDTDSVVISNQRTRRKKRSGGWKGKLQI